MITLTYKYTCDKCGDTFTSEGMIIDFYDKLPKQDYAMPKNWEMTEMGLLCSKHKIVVRVEEVAGS